MVFDTGILPKPSRAAYPCQRAAFPVASSFVLWLASLAGGKFLGDKLLRRLWGARVAGLVTVALLVLISVFAWQTPVGAGPADRKINSDKEYNYAPEAPNQPLGTAQGINPGRVVWVHDPTACKWSGDWQKKSDQWWTDASTDQKKVDAMISDGLRQLTGAGTDEAAWQALFQHYNKKARGLSNRGHRPGEIVALKINLNNSTFNKDMNNFIDASPHAVLGMVRQLVNNARVAPADILIYDAKQIMPAELLKKVWREFKDVRFVQSEPPLERQPKNPGYGDWHGLEASQWVEGMTYSTSKQPKASQIPEQIIKATYLINMALLKAHSYPYPAFMEKGDAGQTAVTLCGKNHFGSILAPGALHPFINPEMKAVANCYSPMVDLAAAPNLGAKTILFVHDALYCGRRWNSCPVHFPNPPFNNRVEPYENPDWPGSFLFSQDPVAIDSVGIDILYSQTKNNTDSQGHPRLLLRDYACDYLKEMAMPDHSPSGTAYQVDGKPDASLGVHEHWDSDSTRQYSRNKSPDGKGIELIYNWLDGK